MLMHRLGDRRGNTATTLALLTPVLMATTAMGVDFGAISVARYQVQASADAAAMAATTALDSPAIAQERAGAYAQRVAVNGVVPSLQELNIGTWNADTRSFVRGGDNPNAVKVKTSVTVPLYFSALLGKSELTLHAEAGAGPRVLPRRAPDTVLVLDVTASMSFREIREERDAALSLLDCVQRRSSPDSRAALVVFGGVDDVQVEMVSYGDDYAELTWATSQVQRCGWRGTPCSNTNPASGYEAALDILRGADTPDDVGQAIVMMSDGEPVPYQGICSRGYLRNDRRGEYRFPLTERCAELGGYGRITDAVLESWAVRAQADAEAAGVDTYTVFYGRDQAGASFLEDHVRAGNGTHSVALRADQMEDEFLDICVETTSASAGMLF